MESFGEWASRTGLWRDIQRLEARQLIEVSGVGPRLDRVIKLTKLGRLMALGGVLPPERWDRGWDGKWRIVVFDIPENERTKRQRLRLWLHTARFGLLQRSVWISPDPLGELAAKVQSETVDCGSLTVFEGNTCLGECAADIVGRAWDFHRIADAYAHWHAHVEQHIPPNIQGHDAKWFAWVDSERRLWQDCMAVDPLLPRELWPKGYAGEKWWKMRMRLLAKFAKIAPLDSTPDKG